MVFTPCEYRTVAHLFGVARSMVCTIVHDTCLAITNSLLKIYISFPTGESLNTVINDLNINGGFLNVLVLLMAAMSQFLHR